MNANQHTARDTASPPCRTAQHQADQTARCQHTHRRATTTPPLLPNNEKRLHTPAQHTGRTRADATRCDTHTHTDPSVRDETPDRKHSNRTDHHCTAQTKNTQQAARRSHSARSRQTTRRGAHGTVDTKGEPRRLRHPTHHCHPRHSADRGAQTHLSETCCEPCQVRGSE